MAEAEKRDHRRLSRQLDLFHIQEEAPGQVFWHPKGWTVYQVIEQYMREQQRLRDYKEIKTPQLVDFSLWERSGHAAKYKDDMFSLVSDENFGWSEALNVNEFRAEQYLHPDLLNCIVSSKGLEFKGAYLDDQNQEIDTFQTMLIDLNELINKPASVTLM